MIINKSNLRFKSSISKRKKTTEIIIHCSATQEGKPYTVNQIHNMHIKNGWAGIGYHYYIDLDGQVWEGRPEAYSGSHVKNHNSISIGVCYCGGLDKKGKPKDTRTDAQIKSMAELCAMLHKKYPTATFHGHNEFAAKDCPCFNVKEWIKTINLDGNEEDNDLIQHNTNPIVESEPSDEKLPSVEDVIIGYGQKTGDTGVSDTTDTEKKSFFLTEFFRNILEKIKELLS